MKMDNNELSQIDIICISMCRADAIISSTGLFLAKEFAKNNRVFFIDHPYSLKEYKMLHLKDQLKNKFSFFGTTIFTNSPNLPNNLTVIRTPLTFPINFLPNGFLYKFFFTINERIVNRSIRLTLKKYEIKRFIFINFSDPFYVNTFAKDIHPIKSIYYCLDNFSEVSYFHKHGLLLETKCIKNYDYILCTSLQLVSLKSYINSKVYYLPNGADSSLFSTALNKTLPIPSELAEIKTPIIGYTGSIEFRIDFELLKKIITENQDKTIVLVGPILTNEYIRLGLDKLPNALFIGPKKNTEMPNYLQCFSCTIIPFRRSITTQYIYPLKINEHLSAGLPVITTNFSEDIGTFSKVAYIADTHDEFIQAINKAIKENSIEKIKDRVQIASQNTWTKRVDRFWEILRIETNSHKLHN